MTHGTDRDTPTDDAAERPVGGVPDAPAAPTGGTGAGTEGAATTPDGAMTGPGEAGEVDEAGVAGETATTGSTGASEDGVGDEEPVEPTEPVEPVESVEPVEPGEPTEPSESVQADDRAEPAEAEAEDAGAERGTDPTTADVVAATPVAGTGAGAGATRPAVRPLAPPQAEPLAAWPSWEDVAVTAPPTVPAAGASVDVDEARPTAEVPPTDVAPGATEQGDPAEPEGHEDAPAAAGPADDARDPDGDPRPDVTADPQPRPVLDLGGFSALAFTALNAASVGVPAHALAQSRVDGADDAGATRPPADDGSAAEGATSGDRLAAPGESSRDARPDGTTAAATDDAQPTDDAARGGGQPHGTTGGPASDDEPAAAVDGPVAAAPTTDDEEPRPVGDDRTDGTPGAATAAAAAATGAATDATAVLPPVDDRRPTDRPGGDPQATTVIAAAPGSVPVAPAASWPRTAGDGSGDGGDGDGPADASGNGRASSPLDGFDAEDGRRRWPRTLAVVAGAVVLLGGLYVGSSYALADRVPRGATVAGVEIGSMSSDEAEQALTDGLAERTTAPVPVVAQEVQSEIDPAAAGLRLDVDATVARLTGVDLAEPVRLWRHLVGVGEQPPVTQVDDDAMDAALTQLTGSLTLAPVDGTVVFADGAAHATEAVDGWELDETGAAAVLADSWLTGTRPLELPTEVLAPAVSEEETQRALREIAQPLTAAPVTVQVGDRQATLDVPTLTAGAALVPVDGTLQLQLDGPALGEAVLAQLPDLLTTAADARFEFQDGGPVIVPGTPGTTLDPAALATSVAQAATAGTDRVAPVELVQSDPAQTTEALEALGVKEIVSQFSTPLTSEPRRTANIAQGLKNITGTLVRPGETFSLTEALGPVDGAHGFVQAGAIVNGEHKDAWGGGLSQVSTTTFNAAFLAGYEDVEHTPHSEWFSRYPEGQEATIFTGTIDMKWKNNTPYGALVQGFVADGRAHVRIWSTKHFTVETSTSGRSGVVAPTTVYSQSPTCEPQSAGNPGFTVTNTRRVYLGEELVDTQSRTWRYKPQNKVVCGSPPAATPAP